jgi:hypothetical protein
MFPVIFDACAGGFPAHVVDALNERMREDPDGDVKHMCMVALSS